MADNVVPTAPFLSTERIAKDDGTPSEYFLRQWETQRGINSEIEGLPALEERVTAVEEETAALKAIDLIAGVGLTGGGDLSGDDRTFDLENTAVTAGTFGDASNVPQITIDAQGRITAAVDIPIVGGGGGTGDIFFDDVVYLSGFEGADGSTDFVDESDFARTLTSENGTEVDTAEFMFGQSSALFDGVNDSINTPDATELELTNEDFTIEMFVRFASLTGNPQVMAAKYLTTGNQRSWFFRRKGVDLNFSYYTNGVTETAVERTWNPVIDQWFHVAVSRNGADLRLFVDGLQLGATENVGTDTIFNGSGNLNLGELPNPTLNIQHLDGWLDEFRMTVGVGRYTTNFTAPIEAFPREGGDTFPSDMPFFKEGVPTNSEILEIRVMARTTIFENNFAGSEGFVGVNPTGAAVIDIQRNGVSIGIAAITTGGLVVFSTIGVGVELFVAGDRLSFVAPSVADASMADIAITLKGASS